MKKKLSFEERQAKIDLMLEKVDYEDDKLSPSDLALAKWSEEAVELCLYVKKLGIIPDMCCEDFLLGFFLSLNFQKLGILQMDESLSRMTNIQVLNLSYNRIGLIEYLPRNLKELYITGNRIVEIRTGKVPSLIHLGAGYNAISNVT